MSKEARATLWAVVAAALLSVAARYQTPNFIVTAPTAQMAEQVGQAAEHYRREIAKEWLGKEMPEWSRPCPVKVRLDNGAGGVTSFRFQDGEVFGWNMSVQGPLDQILQSVLPHEVTHTIFASHFRQPLPRWADEGACTTVEHPKERAKQNQMLVQFLQSGRGIGFHNMFRMKEYPRDMLPLYAQGHSLATFLIGQGGRQKFLAYLADGMQNEERDPDRAWNTATQQHYGFNNLGALQNAWLDWVRQGSPGLEQAPSDISGIASREVPKSGRNPNVVVRGQSADPPAPAAVPSGRLTPVHPVSATVPATSPPTDVSSGEHQGQLSADSPGWRRSSQTTLAQAENGRDSAGPFAEVADARSRGSDVGASSRYIRPQNPAVAPRAVGRHLPDEAPPTRTLAPAMQFPPSSPAFPTCLGGG
jgi:hypothetical protein